MADNNFMGSTVAVAVTAAVFSPRVRGILRSGAVQGLAGVLIAGDAVSSFARGVGRGLQSGDAVPQPDASATEKAQEAGRAAPDAAPASTKAARGAAPKPKRASRARSSAATPRKSAASTESDS